MTTEADLVGLLADLIAADAMADSAKAAADHAWTAWAAEPDNPEVAATFGKARDHADAWAAEARRAFWCFMAARDDQ